VRAGAARVQAGPAAAGGPEVRGYATTTGALLALADWLHRWGVTRVVMESTSDYVRREGA
jgi:hypothetical protein